MSATCHDCGADHGTVGVIGTDTDHPRLCVECLQREGISPPSPLKLSREAKPKLPLRADKWEIDYELKYHAEPEGEGWWLITTHAVVWPGTEESNPNVELMRVYARRKEPKP